MSIPRSAGRISIIRPTEAPSYYNSLVAVVRERTAATVAEVPFTDAARAFCTEETDVVIFPQAATVPYNAGEAIDRYLKHGGKLLTLGGPPLSDVVCPGSGTWMSRDKLATEQERHIGHHKVLDFEGDEPPAWRRQCVDPTRAATLEVGDYGSPDSQTALHVCLDDFYGFEIFWRKITLPDHFKYFSFWGKGAEGTGGVAIQLREADGSLWIAVPALKPEWKQTRLTFNDFAYWFDNPSVGRGFAGDHVHFENVVEIGFGISHSHVGATDGKRYEFCIDSVYMCNDEMPIHDGLAEQWKYFPLTNGRRLTTYDNQVIVSPRDYHLPQRPFALHARAQGTGFEHGRITRFIPLLEVWDDKQLHSGYMAWMFVNSAVDPVNTTVDTIHNGQEYDSSIIAGFGTDDPAFYDENGLAAVVDVLEAMLRDTLFVEAGTEEYLYVASETKEITMGAHVRGRCPRGTVAEFVLTAKGEELLCRRYPVEEIVDTVAGVSLARVADRYAVTDRQPDRITVTLYDGDRMLDRLSHEIVFWSPKPEARRRYVTSGEHEFWRDGKPLRLYGVNYMPSSNVAFDGGNYDVGRWNFEHYVSLSAYDPDVCWRDLLRIKEIGFNAVSLFVYHDIAVKTKNMLHLMEMCDRLGLVVDLALRHYSPLASSDASIADIIRYLHLDELDYIVAYDIAWEQSVGMYHGSYGSVAGGRKTFDPDWVQWVLDTYGSIENAEAAWGVPMPQVDKEEATWGVVLPGSSVRYTGPSNEMLTTDGEHRYLVAAYRRFLDDFVAQKHLFYRDAILAVDPHHLVSARTNYSGLPKFPASHMPYDLRSLAPAFDFMSPECYGPLANIPSLSFTHAYARYACPGAPVVWKEFGGRSWSGSHFLSEDHPDRVEAMNWQVTYTGAVYEVALQCHARAMYYWYYAAGFRPGEKSDYGVTNPDGSERPLTALLRQMRDRFLDQPPMSQPEVVFHIERDDHVDGISGIFAQIEEPFQKAIADGKMVALRDAATDTNTATVPDTAIGGGKAGTTNPSRYVNGLFRQVYGKEAGGGWRQIFYGDTLQVDGPLELRVAVINTTQPEWLSRAQADTAYVSVISGPDSQLSFRFPLTENVRHLETLEQTWTVCPQIEGKKTVSMRFDIEGRFPFGAPFTFYVSAVK